MECSIAATRTQASPGFAVRFTVGSYDDTNEQQPSADHSAYERDYRRSR